MNNAHDLWGFFGWRAINFDEHIGRLFLIISCVKLTQILELGEGEARILASLKDFSLRVHTICSFDIVRVYTSFVSRDRLFGEELYLNKHEVSV